MRPFRTASGIVEYMRRQSDPNWKPPPSAVLTLTMVSYELTSFYLQQAITDLVLTLLSAYLTVNKPAALWPSQL